MGQGISRTDQGGNIERRIFRVPAVREVPCSYQSIGYSQGIYGNSIIYWKNILAQGWTGVTLKSVVEQATVDGTLAEPAPGVMARRKTAAGERADGVDARLNGGCPVAGRGRGGCP